MSIPPRSSPASRHDAVEHRHGKPGSVGRLEREGVLVHREHEAFAALLVLVHPLGGMPTLYGLRRFEDEDRWTDPDEPAAHAMHALHGDNWNDDRDSNGFALASRGEAARVAENREGLRDPG